MKQLFLLNFLIITTFSTAQSFGEVEIKGHIKVPAEADAQGITIYNKNSRRGSVSAENGEFSIYAKLNDSLYFSALQYKDLLLIVDEQAIRSRTLNVEITEDVNELPEVVVRPHELTGNLEVDSRNIQTEKLDLPTMTALSINDYDWEWRPDGQTAVTNAAMPGSAGMQYGVDPLAIIGGIIGLILPPKKAKNRPPSPRNQRGLINLEREIRSRYDNAFFEEVLKIKTSEIADFIDYLNTSGISSDLLDKKREMDLIQLMVEQSFSFRDR
jgi:hypothetical protein